MLGPRFIPSSSREQGAQGGCPCSVATCAHPPSTGRSPPIGCEHGPELTRVGRLLPKPSWPGLAAEDHGIRLCSSAQSSFGVVVMMAKLCTFSFGTDTGSKVVRQDHFKNQRV